MKKAVCIIKDVFREFCEFIRTIKVSTLRIKFIVASIEITSNDGVFTTFDNFFYEFKYNFFIFFLREINVNYSYRTPETAKLHSQVKEVHHKGTGSAGARTVAMTATNNDDI